MNLSIIIPTVGRLSLIKTLDSIFHQAEPDDQVIVIGDGHHNTAELICAKYPMVEYHETEKKQCWGHPQRNLGMELATNSHLSFMDDDDEYTPTALHSIRHVIKMTPDRPLMFQMQYPNRFILWQTPTLEQGNVGTPMIVVPNDPKKLGVWTERREGDFDFMKGLKWDKISWWPVIIAKLGYNEGG